MLGKMQLPAGVHWTMGGDAESQQEVFGQIFSALGLAILLMYLILVVQFGSFVDPIAIMMSLPLSLIGVMLALAVSGLTINLMSLIGVILLMGLVAKNAILLIDFAKWAREDKGLPLREALIEAGAIRLRPILMTTFALIAGMLPVALGMLLPMRGKLDRNRGGVTYGLLCGIATGLGTLGYFAALREQNASVVTPLTGVFPVLTVVLAFVVLRERLNKVQMGGMLLALASIVILSI